MGYLIVDKNNREKQSLPLLQTTRWEDVLRESISSSHRLERMTNPYFSNTSYAGEACINSDYYYSYPRG